MRRLGAAVGAAAGSSSSPPSARAASTSAAGPAPASRLVFGPGAWGSWFAMNDTVMGGISDSHMRLPMPSPAGASAAPSMPPPHFTARSSASASPSAATFEGAVRTENRGGFASVRANVPPAVAPSLAGCTRFVVTVRGDGKPYLLRVERRTGAGTGEGGQPLPDVPRGVYYDATFQTTRGVRQSVVVPVAAMEPRWRGQRVAMPPLTSCADAAALGLMITKDAGAGDFALEVFSVHCSPD